MRRELSWAYIVKLEALIDDLFIFLGMRHFEDNYRGRIKETDGDWSRPSFGKEGGDDESGT